MFAKQIDLGIENLYNKVLQSVTLGTNAEKTTKSIIKINRKRAYNGIEVEDME
jgi:hypothetical protein